MQARVVQLGTCDGILCKHKYAALQLAKPHTYAMVEILSKILPNLFYPQSLKFFYLAPLSLLIRFLHETQLLHRNINNAHFFYVGVPGVKQVVIFGRDN